MKTKEILDALEQLSMRKRVRVALFVAERVLPVYESYYPRDKRPRIAVEKGKLAVAAIAAIAAAAAAAYAADAAAYAAASAAAADVDATAAAADAVERAIRAGTKKETILHLIERQK